MDSNQVSESSLDKESSGKETEPQEKMETSKRETSSFMQDEDIRNYSDDEKAILMILSNTCKVYQYHLSDEYMLNLMKHNGMVPFFTEYVTMVKDQDIRLSKCFIHLGESSLMRFLINKEKSVFQFPPSETDDLMIVRDAECSAKLKLNK